MSSSVVTSPLTVCDVTISRSSRRMILPLRVFGSASVKRISSGRAKGADLVRDPLPQLFPEFVVIVLASLESHEAAYRLTGNLVRLTDYRRFGHGGMTHQRRFDFHRAQAVAADVHDVIHPAKYPVISIVIAARGIACEVGAGNAGPVLFLETLRIAPDGPHHTRPRALDNQESFTIVPDGIA